MTTETLQPEVTQAPDWQAERMEAARAHISEFINNPGLASVMERYAPGFSELESEDERCDAFVGVAREYFDMRKNRERQAVTEAADIDEEGSELGALFMDAGDQLGMIQSSFVEPGHKKRAIVLGAAAGSVKARFDWLGEQNAAYDEVYYFGCERLTSDAEKKVAEGYAPGARTEYELGVGAITSKLGPFKDQDAHDFNSDFYRIAYFESQKGYQIFAISAPPSDGRLRANTSDTIEFYKALGRDTITPGDQTDVFTNAHYTQFQQFDFDRHGLYTGEVYNVVGFNAAFSGNVRKPSQIRQEMLSAANSMQLLREHLSQLDAAA